MHDEGATHYNSIIDQHSLGAEFLRDEFGDCARPKIGWQIDPFGHSREVASLFAQVRQRINVENKLYFVQMGFDGLFFGRADYQDFAQRKSTKTMEMIWKGSASLGRQSWLFTGVLPNGYGPPGWFCFDIFCTDDPIMVISMFKQLLFIVVFYRMIQHFTIIMYQIELNYLSKLHTIKYLCLFSAIGNHMIGSHPQANAYTTNHIIMTMGGDFQYQHADLWFKNMDKLIKYVNALVSLVEASFHP